MQFCTKCGKELPDGAAFCSFCGTPTTGVSQVVATQNTSGSDGLLSELDIVMKKKIMSLREHYDFEDRSARNSAKVTETFSRFQLNLSSNLTTARS